MGLEGTLKAFSLSDIFQVLGLQRKSGVLLVENDDDTITISFLGGQIVSAESKKHRQDNQIGKLLLRAGRINEAELARARRHRMRGGSPCGRNRSSGRAATSAGRPLMAPLCVKTRLGARS